MSDEPIGPICRDFAGLLKVRLDGRVPTTEDSVRYTFFAALLRNGVAPDEVVLEFPHPRIPRAEVDTWMPDFHGTAVAMEFKYDRDLPGGKNPPKTQKAGAVFKDLRRLRLLADVASCYLVYVTTREMDVYFRNPSNGHEQFYDLLPGNSVRIGESYFAGKPQTLLRTLGGTFDARVTGVMKRSLGSHSLRVYRVNST